MTNVEKLLKDWKEVDRSTIDKPCAAQLVSCIMDLQEAITKDNPRAETIPIWIREVTKEFYPLGIVGSIKKWFKAKGKRG